LSLAQSSVDDKFRMLVPVYPELDDGKIAFWKSIKNKPRGAVINYFDDVLVATN
jgi:hypothetical protein